MSIMRSESFRRALGPTMVCVYALLVLKTAQQGFMDSLPLFTVRAAARREGVRFQTYSVLSKAPPAGLHMLGTLGARRCV